MSAQAAIIASPSVSGFSSEFSGGFLAANVFDNNASEFASAGNGTNTFLEFTFPIPTTFDRVIVVNRNSPDGSDRIANYTLTYDGGAGGSTSVTRGDLGSWRGGFDALGTHTATTVRLDVDTLGGAANNNTGAAEVYFLNTPTGMSPIPGVTVFNSATPFNGNYGANQAVDGLVGIGDFNEFATSGTGAFLEMDLGSLQTVGGFDFFDRIIAAEANTSFDVTFSVDSVFGNGDDIVQNYTGSTQSAEFAGIDARYVRYEQTGGAGNSGVAEIQFYSVIPEPSSTALFGIAGLALIMRRRK